MSHAIGWLHLASAALPVGAFSHSLGMEAAIEAGLVHDAASAEVWVGDYLRHGWASCEARQWRVAFAAWQDRDEAALSRIHEAMLACRDSAELRLENEQTGHALRQWLQSLPELAALDPERRRWLEALRPPAWACVHACAALVLGLDERQGLHALGWSLAENLVAAALKLVPLGQVAGQAILRRMALQLPALIDTAAQSPAAICNFTPMLGILSARHETQYTRLFRS